jgi:hypothetical protein
MSLLIFSSIGMVGAFFFYYSQQRSLIYALMLAGAIQWMVGNLLLMTKNFYPLAFPWWMGFILFVITSERLELMKFLPVSTASRRLLIIILIVFLVGVLISFHWKYFLWDILSSDFALADET